MSQCFEEVKEARTRNKMQQDANRIGTKQIMELCTLTTAMKPNLSLKTYRTYNPCTTLLQSVCFVCLTLKYSKWLITINHPKIKKAWFEYTLKIIWNNENETKNSNYVRQVATSYSSLHAQTLKLLLKG